MSLTIVTKEPMWHMELAVLFAILLQFFLAPQFSFGPKFVMLILEGLLLGTLILLRSAEDPKKHQWHRRLMLSLTALVTLANIFSLILVLRALIYHGVDLDGHALILSALATFFTNIIIFGLWYWQLDGGGPGGRGTHQPPVDFLFTQMTTGNEITKSPNWRPGFFDYLYLSITNATAFSPTDVLPLTHRAKLLMSIQSLTSLATIAVVAARAVNILR